MKILLTVTMLATSCCAQQVQKTNMQVISAAKKIKVDLNDEFFHAIFFENLDCMAKLVSRGVYDARLADEDGRTPLMLAAQFASVTSINFLLALGVDHTAKDNKGHTFIDYVSGNKRCMERSIAFHNDRVKQGCFTDDYIEVQSDSLFLGLLDKVEEKKAVELCEKNAIRVKQYAQPQSIEIQEPSELQQNLRKAIFKRDRNQIAEYMQAGADHTTAHMQLVIQNRFFDVVRKNDEEAKKYWVSLGADPNAVDVARDLDDEKRMRFFGLMYYDLGHN